MFQVNCHSSLGKGVIHLSFFDLYFISPKYILYKINQEIRSITQVLSSQSLEQEALD